MGAAKSRRPEKLTAYVSTISGSVWGPLVKV